MPRQSAFAIRETIKKVKDDFDRGEISEEDYYYTVDNLDKVLTDVVFPQETGYKLPPKEEGGAILTAPGDLEKKQGFGQRLLKSMTDTSNLPVIGPATTVWKNLLGMGSGYPSLGDKEVKEYVDKIQTMTPEQRAYLTKRMSPPLLRMMVNYPKKSIEKAVGAFIGLPLAVGKQMKEGADYYKTNPKEAFRSLLPTEAGPNLWKFGKEKIIEPEIEYFKKLARDPGETIIDDPVRMLINLTLAGKGVQSGLNLVAKGTSKAANLVSKIPTPANNFLQTLLQKASKGTEAIAKKTGKASDAAWKMTPFPLVNDIARKTVVSAKSFAGSKLLPSAARMKQAETAWNVQKYFAKQLSGLKRKQNEVMEGFWASWKKLPKKERGNFQKAAMGGIHKSKMSPEMNEVLGQWHKIKGGIQKGIIDDLALGKDTVSTVVQRPYEQMFEYIKKRIKNRYPNEAIQTSKAEQIMKGLKDRRLGYMPMGSQNVSQVIPGETAWRGTYQKSRGVKAGDWAENPLQHIEDFARGETAAAMSREFVNSIKTIALPLKKGTKVQEGWGVWQPGKTLGSTSKGGQKYQLPESILKLFKSPKEVRNLLGLPESGAISKIFDIGTDIWRMSVLPFRLAWIAYNAAGNAVFNTIHGVGPRSYAMAFQKWAKNQVPNSLRSTFAGTELEQGFLKTHGNTAFDEVMQNINKTMFVKGVSHSANFMMKLNDKVENYFRNAGYIHKQLKWSQKKAAIDTGKSFYSNYHDFRTTMQKYFAEYNKNPELVDKGVNFVNTALNDYGKIYPILGESGQRMLRKAVPFWKFYRHAVDMLFALPVRHPGVAKTIDRLGEMGQQHFTEAWEGFGIERDNLPEYMKSQYPVMLKTYVVKDNFGREYPQQMLITYNSQGPMPFSGVDTGGLSMLHPLINVMLRKATGGKVIGDSFIPDAYPFEADKTSAEDEALHKIGLGQILLEQFPQYGAIRDLVTPFKQYATGTILNPDVQQIKRKGFMTGIPKTVIPRWVTVGKYMGVSFSVRNYEKLLKDMETSKVSKVKQNYEKLRHAANKKNVFGKYTQLPKLILEEMKKRKSDAYK